MEEPHDLGDNRHWRTAVWALRVGFGGLVVAVVGIIDLLSGSTPWVLAAGVLVWLVAAAVTLAGFLRARQEIPEPRPGFWAMRWMIIHDAVHARS